MLAATALNGCNREDAPRNLSAEEVAGQLQAMRIEPGLWIVTSEIEDVRAPDLPVQVRARMLGPRSGLRHCITPAQAAQPASVFLAGQDERPCRYTDFRVENGRVEGTMSCPGMDARMEGDYRPDAFEMRFSMTSPLPDGAQMTIESRTRGQRLGPCEEEEG